MDKKGFTRLVDFGDSQKSAPINIGVSPKFTTGFTLIEILVAVAIIGVLSSIVVVSVNVARTKGRIAAGKQFDASVLHSIGDQLVAEWTFDVSGSPWADTSGMGHNGSCGSCPVVATGYNGRSAYSFNGSGNHIAAGTGNNFFPLSTFSVCAWIKTPGLATGMNMNGIISMTYGMTFSLDSSGRFVTYIDSGSALPGLVASPNLHDDQFHNLCLSVDGVNRSMYIDGALRALAATTWLGTTRWPTNTVNIGTENNNAAVRWFNGLIDDVRIYAYALNSAQIEKLYAEKKDFYLAKK